MLTIENVSFGYRRNSSVISDLTLTLEPGTVCGLLGPNGVGKTTLIYLICGLLQPKTGTISYNGHIPFDRNVSFLEDVFLVPEEFSTPPISLSDYINVNAPFYPKFDREAMNSYLDIFELSPNLNLGEVSMGQKKKAFLSFAMACNTSLLILDEPTNGLDITAKRAFRSAVAKCMDENKTILISTHQVYDIDKVLDHVIIESRNGILLNSSMAEISSHYKFSFTTDRSRAEQAMMYLDVPGGYNIIEPLTDPMEETEVNLETLYEFIIHNHC